MTGLKLLKNTVFGAAAGRGGILLAGVVREVPVSARSLTFFFSDSIPLIACICSASLMRRTCLRAYLFEALYRLYRIYADKRGNGRRKMILCRVGKIWVIKSRLTLRRRNAEDAESRSNTVAVSSHIGAPSRSTTPQNSMMTRPCAPIARLTAARYFAIVRRVR